MYLIGLRAVFVGDAAPKDQQYVAETVSMLSENAVRQHQAQVALVRVTSDEFSKPVMFSSSSAVLVICPAGDFLKLCTRP